MAPAEQDGNRAKGQGGIPELGLDDNRAKGQDGKLGLRRDKLPGPDDRRDEIQLAPSQNRKEPR